MSEDAKSENMEENLTEAAAAEHAIEEPSETELLKTEVAELKDRLLRTMAEMENVRRRADREKSDASSYAVTGFARDMLTVSDNMRRALAGLPTDIADDMKPFIDGIEMTERELLSNFEKHGIKRVEPQAGDKFDHNLHQAMFEVPTSEVGAGSIAQVVTHGYVIKDRLLRPAMVGVAVADKAPQEKIDTTV